MLFFHANDLLRCSLIARFRVLSGAVSAIIRKQSIQMRDIVVLCNARLGSLLRRSITEHGGSACIVHDLESLRLSSVDDSVLVAFSTGVIVPPDVLDRVERAYNFHPGSPGFPGRDPHYWAMLEGVEEFGCVAHVMAERVDSGPIIATRSFDTSGIRSAEVLRRKTEIVMFGLFESLLTGILDGSLVPTNECWSGRKRSRKDFVTAGYTFEDRVPSELPSLEPYDLGNALYFGLHTDKNVSAAKLEFEKAAGQMHPQALLRLAREAHDDGNRTQAIFWASRAEKYGNKAASGFLKALHPIEPEKSPT
jgi:hypothetical protein